MKPELLSAAVTREGRIHALAFAIVFGLAVFATPSAQTQTYTVLHAFAGGSDGANPYAGLIMDAQGNLYGTTDTGGVSKLCNGVGCGTVFKVTKAGEETVLYTFSSNAGGLYPYAGLVMDAQGNLYGTNLAGGDQQCVNGQNDGCGVVFEIDTTGKETVLHSFAGIPDGAFAYGGLIMDAQGNLYGTTLYGGNPGYGSVFKVTQKGEETVLYSFQGAPDGKYPAAGLVMDSDGNFYGTTTNGGGSDGDNGCSLGCGTVFKVSRAGKETILHRFKGSADGEYPEAALLIDAQGNLYGTTSKGGRFNGGTVFKLATTGKISVLHNFKKAGGLRPFAGLVMDASGNLYGTTKYGGNSTSCAPHVGCGVVFKLDKSGHETVLYNFTAGTGGETPYAGLVMDATGNLYGTASTGVTEFNYGTVFKLTP